MIHIELKRISLEPDSYGSNILVRLVTAFKNGKYIKHVKLDDKVLAILLDTKIPITEDQLKLITGGKSTEQPNDGEPRKVTRRVDVDRRQGWARRVQIKDRRIK